MTVSSAQLFRNTLIPHLHFCNRSELYSDQSERHNDDDNTIQLETISRLRRGGHVTGQRGGIIITMI